VGFMAGFQAHWKDWVNYLINFLGRAKRGGRVIQPPGGRTLEAGKTLVLLCRTVSCGCNCIGGHVMGKG